MKRLLQLFALGLSLLVLLIAGVFLWLKSMDPQVLSDQLRAALEHATGRSVTISGPLQVTLRPLPSVSVSQVMIANPDWAKSPKMLAVQRLTIRPSLRSLLRGQVLLHEINIAGVQLWLENGPDGQPSWLFEKKGSSPVGVPEIRVQSLRASKLRGSYFDAQDGITRSLSLDEFDATAGGSNQPIKIAVQGTVMQLPLSINGQIGSPNQVLGGQPFSFSVQGSLGQSQVQVEGKLLDLDFRDLTGVEAKITASGKQPKVLMAWTDLAIPKMDHFAFSYQVSGKGDILQMENLDASLGDPSYTMHITGGAADLLRLSGLALEFESSGVSPVSFLPRIQGAWLATDQYSATGKLVGSMSKMDLTDLKIDGKVKETELTLTGTLGDLAGAGAIDVTLKIDGRHMASVSSFFELPVPDVDQLSGSLHASGTWDSLDISDLQATLREGSMSGTLSGNLGSVTDLDHLDIELKAEGGDIRDLQSLLGTVQLPQTDKASATLGLSGKRGDLSLQIKQLDLQRASIRLSGIGWLQDLGDIPRLDMKVDANGTDLRDVGKLGLPDIGDLNLPATDKFRIQGRLRGHLSEPDLNDIVAEAQLGAIKVDLSGRLPGLPQPKTFQIKGAVTGDDLARLGDTLGKQWPTSTSFSVQASARGSWAHPRIESLSGDLKTTEMSLQLNGSIGDVRAIREVNLDIEASASSLTGLVPGDGKGWERMGAASTRFTLSGGPTSFDLDLEQLDAGDSQIQGLLAVITRDEKLVSISGDLKGSKLDLTPWLGPAAASGADSRVSTKSSDKPHRRNDTRLLFPDQPLPVAWMKGLQVDLDLTNLALGLGATQLKVLEGQLEIGQNVFAIDPFRIGYQNDEITGLFRLDVDTEPNSLKVQLKSLDFDLGSLVQRMGSSSDARGKVDVLLQLETSGDTPRAMASAADGRFSMLLQDGFSGEKMASLSVTEALWNLLPWSRSKDGTTVDCAMADFPITSGIATSHLLVLDTSDMLMRGSGEIDLRQERYDLLLKPRPKRGRAMGFNANVRVTGPLDDPHFGLATGSTAVKAAGTVGRFALLGPLGLFVSADNFVSKRQECAESLEGISKLK